MANLPVIAGDSSTKYLATFGAGSDPDPLFREPCSVTQYTNLGITGQVVKNAAALLFGFFFYNAANGIRYLKVYNKDTTPSSSDVNPLIYPLPPNVGGFIAIPKAKMSAGIGVRATKGRVDNDNIAPDADDVLVQIFWA